jgi:hypothetical protein
MLRILSLAAVVGLLAGPARAGDQQTYTIKIKKPAQGTVTRVDKAESGTQKVKAVDNDGNVLQEKDEKTGDRYLYTQTILEKPAGKKATRLKRQYEKATVTEEGEQRKLPYEGKTVLIEKKGDKYIFRIEGGEELTGDDAKHLDKEFNKKEAISDEELEKLLLPGKAVRLNEEWKIPAAQLARGFAGEGLEIDAAKSTATGKLTRAYKKDGRQFGVLVYQLKLAVKSTTAEGKKVQFQPESRAEVEVRADACIDGSSATGKATITTSSNMLALLPSPDQPKARVTVTVRSKATDSTVEQGSK